MEDSDLAKNNERVTAYEMRRAWGEIAEQVKLASRLINAFQERYQMNDAGPRYAPHSRFSKTWRELKREEGRSPLPLIVVIGLWVVICALVFFAL